MNAIKLDKRFEILSGGRVYNKVVGREYSFQLKNYFLAWRVVTPLEYGSHTKINQHSQQD
ncbi:hypothetical protein ASF73_16300 [Xanthomonas sp. Leaf131]|nr:hypothetical protein ASF73_16300 [Xanthomonas sp. Leaf131]